MKRIVIESGPEFAILIACGMSLFGMFWNGRVYLWEGAFQVGSIIILTLALRRYRITSQIWRSVAITATWSLENGEPDDQGLHRNRRQSSRPDPGGTVRRLDRNRRTRIQR